MNCEHRESQDPSPEQLFMSNMISGRKNIYQKNVFPLALLQKASKIGSVQNLYYSSTEHQ